MANFRSNVIKESRNVVNVKLRTVWARRSMFPRSSAIRPGRRGKKVFWNWKLLPFRALRLIGDWMGKWAEDRSFETTVFVIKFLVHRGIIFVYHSDKENYVFEQVGGASRRSRGKTTVRSCSKNLLGAKKRDPRTDICAPFGGEVVLSPWIYH